MDKKIIAVTGATGAQGGGLVRAILADKSGDVRGPGHHPQAERATRRRRWPSWVSRSWRPIWTTWPA